jgi:hypothetical protein
MHTTEIPVIVKGYHFPPEFFSKGYPAGSGPCSCSSACCEGGVYADVTERDRILSVREIIKTFMDETQTPDDKAWFEEEESEDPDFISGRCVGTNVHNGKCVFLDRYGRCSIQVAATDRGLHKWAWKPLFCVLYPVVIAENEVGFDDMLQDEHACCTLKEEYALPFFVACREELEHLLGKDGYSQLEEHYRTLAK